MEEDQTTNANNTYYNRIVKEQGKDAADAIMRKMAPVGSNKSGTGGFGTEKRNKNGLTGKEQARVAGKKGGAISRRKK